MQTLKQTQSRPLHIVLVRTIYSRNIGSVSRVMANMGADRLILIDPKCDIDLEARQGAAGAQTHLLEHSHYPSWDEFFKNEDEGLLIAFCARKKKEMDLLPIEERMVEIAKDVSNEKKPIYLIFGPEDHGLEKIDTHHAHFICTLPIFGPFNSLNISHAVLLALYIAKKTLPNLNAVQPFAVSHANEDKNVGVKSDKFHFPDEPIQNWLTLLGFEIGGRRTDAYQILNRLLLRNIPTAKEMHILESVIIQTVRKLKENNKAKDEYKK
jgi:tRNA/rRNA methyltransferase